MAVQCRDGRMCPGQLAEVAGEALLLGLVEVDIVEHQRLVLVERGAERDHGVRVEFTARIDTDPFLLVVDAKGLGPPKAWLRADGPNAAAGATVYGVMLSESDDDALSAGIACVLDQRGHCEIDDLPKRTPTYRRLSILALVDADTSPTLADGYDRLVVTHSFDPPLQEVP